MVQQGVCMEGVVEEWSVMLWRFMSMSECLDWPKLLSKSHSIQRIHIFV